MKENAESLYENKKIHNIKTWIVRICAATATGCVIAMVIQNFLSGMSALNFKKVELTYLFLVAIPLLTAATIILFDIYRFQKKSRKLKTIFEENGFCDKYYELFSQLVNERNKNKENGKLIIAGEYVQGERFDDCCKILKQTDFHKLNEREQEEWFNDWIYAKLLDGKTDEANEIYGESADYFQRAVRHGKCPEIMHTLALLEYENKRFLQAEQLYISALKFGAKKKLKCDCMTSIGFCRLERNDIEGAKKAAKTASRYRHKSEKLNELLRLIELQSDAEIGR